MVSKYIKSIWQSNYTSQVKTKATTFIDTVDEQLQNWPLLLRFLHETIPFFLIGGSGISGNNAFMRLDLIS